MQHGHGMLGSGETFNFFFFRQLIDVYFMQFVLDFQLMLIYMSVLYASEVRLRFIARGCIFSDSGMRMWVFALLL